MTISKFWQLGLKAFFRAPQWEVAIIARIFLGLFALFAVVYVLGFGVAAYYIVEKLFPDTPAIEIINRAVFFLFLVEFIARFFFQQPPSTQVQSWILLPIKKKKIINNILLRSVLSPYNLSPWLLYLPVAVVRVIEGTAWTASLSWFSHLLCLTLILNFLIFLVNKSNRLFITTLILVALGVGLEFYTNLSVFKAFASGLKWLELNPFSLLLSFGLLLLFYKLAYRFLKSQFYLDMGLAKKSEKVLRLGFAFLGGYGRLGAFLKNDLRLLLRNARPRQILLVTFLLLFYGLFFFLSDLYNTNSMFMVFASLFITGGFSMTYGQQVPAWDSEYYALLMTQNLTYRAYLESKWWLMTTAVVISLILATFYIIFGWEVYAFVLATAMFNMGLGTYINLYSGAYHRVPMKLNVKAKAFENTKAFNLTQLLFTIPKLALPVLIYWLADVLIPWEYSGWLALTLSGVLGLLLKNQILNHLAKIYRAQKYKTIHAFSKN